MQGLTDEQIVDLKLKDEWAEKCYPSGGHINKKDEIGRRNGMGELYLLCIILIRKLEKKLCPLIQSSFKSSIF